MTGRVWRLRPFHASACVMLAALMVSGAAVAETTLLSHFELISATDVSNFFNTDQWLYDQVVYPVTVPLGVGSTYGNLPGAPYEVIAYSNGVEDGDLSRGPGAMGSMRGLRIEDSSLGTEPVEVVFQFARIIDVNGDNDAANPITFVVDDTVEAENADPRVRDWSDYSYLSFFLYVDSTNNQSVGSVGVKVQEYRQGSLNPTPPPLVLDLERAVYATTLARMGNAGYGPPRVRYNYSGWQHWLIPLPNTAPSLWSFVRTNPDGSDTYPNTSDGSCSDGSCDGVYTSDSIRAVVFEKPNNADYDLVIDEIVLTRRCNARIARVFPGYRVQAAGLCEAAIGAGPPPGNRADVTLRTANPLALLTTFGVTLETGSSPPQEEDRPLVEGSPQGHYMSELGMSIWNEATDSWRQPQTLIVRWPGGMAERRGYIGSDGDDDLKHSLHTDRRYASDGVPVTMSGYLSTMYEASDTDPDNRRVAFTLFILPKGEDSDGDITVGQGDCVDVLIEAQPRPQVAGVKRLWRRTMFGIP